MFIAIDRNNYSEEYEKLNQLYSELPIVIDLTEDDVEPARLQIETDHEGVYLDFMEVGPYAPQQSPYEPLEREARYSPTSPTISIYSESEYSLVDSDSSSEDDTEECIISLYDLD